MASDETGRDEIAAASDEAEVELHGAPASEAAAAESESEQGELQRRDKI
jgi:hypothetical protein